MGIIDLPPIKGLFAQPIALEHILDKIPLGIVLLNLHRRIVFLNQGIQALTGFSNKEALGIPCYNILRSKICIQRCPALNINKESILSLRINPQSL